MSVPEFEWSHNIETDEVGVKSVSLQISPDEEQAFALSKRLGVISIEKLEADLTLTRNDVNKVIHVEGKVLADITQECVVTMDPVAEHVEETFEAWYAEPSSAVSFTKAKRERMSVADQDEQPIIDEFDDPETVVDGKIDLGELVTQHFSLALNSYPRADDAPFETAVGLKDAPEGTYDNPFAALKDWKAGEAKKEK